MLGQIVPEQCIACGICQLQAPQLFEYDAAGIAYFKNQPNPYLMAINDMDSAAFRKALTSCPTGAIQRHK